MSRLEEIKKVIPSIQKGMPKEIITWAGWKSVVTIFTEDSEYLLEQAERVEELEEEKEFFRIKLVETKAVESGLRSLIKELRKENERYKQALEFYADEETYELDISYNPAQAIDCMVLDDSGHQARQALEDE